MEEPDNGAVGSDGAYDSHPQDRQQSRLNQQAVATANAVGRLGNLRMRVHVYSQQLGNLIGAANPESSQIAPR